MGASVRGKEANARWYFHPTCWHAVAIMHGWDREVVSPSSVERPNVVDDRLREQEGQAEPDADAA